MKPKMPQLPNQVMQNFSADFLNNERVHSVLESTDQTIPGDALITTTTITTTTVKETEMSPKTLAMMQSAVTFLENEKQFHFIQAGGVDNPRQEVIVSQVVDGIKNGSHQEEIVQKNEIIGITQTRTEKGKHGPKVYTTTCYFKPKQHPVSYSETVIVNIGSKKKHYYESVYYENHLTPLKWSESVTARFLEPYKGPTQCSTSTFKIEKEDVHIIPLEAVSA